MPLAAACGFARMGKRREEASGNVRFAVNPQSNRGDLMRVLVTGGAGFIGSHVVDELLARGHEPAVFDDLSSGKRCNVPDGVRLFEGDLRDGGRVAQVFDELRPDAVCHLAAQVSVSRSVREPVFDAEVNVLGSLHVFSQSARLGVRRIAFASSGGALYGDVETPAGEDHACLPISPYGLAKLTGERYLEFFSARHGLQGVAMRFSNVYGPRQDPHGEAGVVAIFATKMLAGEAVTINGDGQYLRDYVEVTDVARAVVAALEAEQSEPFLAFNVGTATGTDVNELAHAMLPVAESIRTKAGKCGPLPRPTYGPPRAGDLRSSIVSRDRITQELGWSPRKGLAEGLRETVEWFAART
jgi:UDP-glucose 4-epimerase